METAGDPEILILAAGASSRMRGVDKLLEMIDGVPLIRRTVMAALTLGLPVTVALRADRPDRDAALVGLPVKRVRVNYPDHGLSASLQDGLAAIRSDVSIMVLLADLPDLTASDLQQVLDAWRETPDLIVRGSSQTGVPGHPVGFPPWSRAGLVAVFGDSGANSMLKAQGTKVRLIGLPGTHAIADLDTPEDWATWRALRAK